MHENVAINVQHTEVLIKSIDADSKLFLCLVCVNADVVWLLDKNNDPLCILRLQLFMGKK